MSKEETSLVVIEEGTVLDLFTKEGELKKILDPIQFKMVELIGNLDATTKKGRDAIRSAVNKGVESRTYVVRQANGLTTDWKAQTKLVNGFRDQFISDAKAQEEELRKPLTDWEAAEKSRKAKIVEMMQIIADLPKKHYGGRDLTVEEMGNRLSQLQGMEITKEVYGLFTETAQSDKDTGIETLGNYISQKVQADEDAERLRVLEEEQAKRDADAQKVTDLENMHTANMKTVRHYCNFDFESMTLRGGEEHLSSLNHCLEDFSAENLGPHYEIAQDLLKISIKNLTGLMVAEKKKMDEEAIEEDAAEEAASVLAAEAKKKEVDDHNEKVATDKAVIEDSIQGYLIDRYGAEESTLIDDLMTLLTSGKLPHVYIKY